MKKTSRYIKRIIAFFLATALFLCSAEVSFAGDDEIPVENDISVNEGIPEQISITMGGEKSRDVEIPDGDENTTTDENYVDAYISESAENTVEVDVQAEDAYLPGEELTASQEDSFGFRMVPGENDIEVTDTSFADESEGFCAIDMPAKYITNELPDLRDQFYSTCWAHATMALAEINLMKKGVIAEADLSELHTVWFSYHSVTDPIGGTEGDSNGVPSGTNILGIGGNPIFSQNVLAGWTGAADEEILKSSDAGKVRNKSLVPSDELAYSDAAHLTNFYEVNLKEDPTGAKSLIKEKGAIAISYYSASSSSPLTDSDTYNSATGAYYDQNTHGGKQNHAVVVVGWDDDFSKDNFVTKPAKDGAWLVRNSWTTGSSAEGIENPSYAGYFWMSYENASLAAGARAFEMEASDNYAHNYQYDGAMYRKGWTPDSYSKNELKTANIFTAKACEKGEYIRAAAFQTSSANLQYKIELYTDLRSFDNPESGRKITEATATGTTQFPGYYTVPLSVPVPVYSGESFAVVVTLKKTGGVPDIGREQSWSGWATIKADIKEGQSFYYDGGWKDVYSLGTLGGNLVIKAFTDDIPEDAVFVPEALEFEGGLSRTGLTISPGEEKVLRIYFTPYYVSDPAVTWSCSDPDIAFVDSDGVLHALAEGSAIITAVSNAAPEVTNSFAVTVRKEEKWYTDPVKEADEETRAALSEDLSITGEAEDGTLTDAQLYEILSRMSTTDDSGNRTNMLWVGGIDDSDMAYVYTGAAIRPAIHIYDGIKLLKEKKDYTLSYENSKNAGQAKITVRFKGNYAGTSKVINYTIAPAQLGSDITVDEIVINPKKNNGKQKPVPVLRNAETGAVLSYKASDFEITYFAEDDKTSLGGVTAPGNYFAHITAKSKKTQNFLGETHVPILVTTELTPISRASVSMEKKSYVYTGDEIMPKLLVTDTTRNDILREGVDYRLDIRNNINPGKATAIITGTGTRYAGVKSMTFQIKKGKRATSDSISLEYEQTVPYLKSGAVPKVTVTDAGRRLTKGVDYTITCENNKQITQKATLKVKFKGNYAGTLTRYFSIERKDLGELQSEMQAADVVLTGKAGSYKKTSITLTDSDGKKLSSSDYEIMGFVNADDGSEVVSPRIGDRIIVTVKGKGGYSGEASAAYTLISSDMKFSGAKQAKKLPAVSFSGVAATLPGSAFEGLLTTSSGKPLIPGEDFEIVSFSDNTACGTAHVTLRGIPKEDGTGFGGMRTFSFTIKPRKAENLYIYSKQENRVEHTVN